MTTTMQVAKRWFVPNTTGVEIVEFWVDECWQDGVGWQYPADDAVIREIRKPIIAWRFDEVGVIGRRTDVDELHYVLAVGVDGEFGGDDGPNYVRCYAFPNGRYERLELWATDSLEDARTKARWDIATMLHEEIARRDKKAGGDIRATTEKAAHPSAKNARP